MAHESPRKRRKTTHDGLDEEDADELLRRFQRKPAPATLPAAATLVSSPHSTSSKRSGSEEDELKDHEAAGNGKGTQSRVTVPRFGEQAINVMNGKTNGAAKNGTGKTASPRPRSARGSNTPKAQAKVQKASASDSKVGRKDVGQTASPRHGSLQGSGSEKEQAKVYDKANDSNDGRKDENAGLAASPLTGSSKESAASQEKAASHNGEVRETRSTSRPRHQHPEPSVLENGNTDRRIADHRRERDLLTVKDFWNDEAYERYKDASPGTAELLGFLSKQFSEETARHYILNEALLRIDRPSPGAVHAKSSREPQITCGDVKKAREKMKAKVKARGTELEDPKDLQPPELDAQLLRKLNLRVGASGLLEPVPVHVGSVQEAAPAESPNLSSASPKEPVRKKSATSPLAASNSPAPLPTREESTHSTQSPKEQRDSVRRKSLVSLQSWKNEDLIDLTMDDPLPATDAPPVVSKPKQKFELPPATDIITIDSSNSTTRRTTPVPAKENRAFNGESDSYRTSKPKPEAPVTNNSMRASASLLTYTLMPKKKKRKPSVANESEVKQTPTDLQPAGVRAAIEQQQPVRQASYHSQTSSGHQTLPNSATPQGGRATNLQQSSDKQHSSAKATSVVEQSPSVQQKTSNNQPLTSIPQVTPSGTWKAYSREEDCLIVYLKTVLGTSQKALATFLPGRTPGALNTRYWTKLKDSPIPLPAAIECLEKSPEFRQHLNPARHNEILNRLPVVPVARPVPAPPRAIAMARPSSSNVKASHAPSASLPFKNVTMTEDESSDHSHSAASGRERERRTRKAINYNVKAYFSGTRIDHDSEPLDEVTPPVQSVTQGIQILPKVSKPQKSYKYANPYLASHERKFLRQGLEAGTWDAEELSEWRGTSVHIGLSMQELEELQKVAVKVLEHSKISQFHPRKRFEAVMKNSSEADIFEIAALASESKALPYRSKESIEAALRDAQDGCLDDATMKIDDGYPTTPIVSSMTRRRELGTSRRGIPIEMKTKVYDTIGPSISFTGTSNDLNTVAWAPNGVQFAAGSTCHVDYDSMQYNRPNNLLFGSMHDKSLHELPEHHTLREKPASGPNSQHSMHITQDRRLFQTVASVCFSPDGSSMYSAGYDGMVRFWDVNESGAQQRLKMWRNGKVDLLSVSKTGMLATAAQRTISNAITVFDPDQSGDLERWSISSFTSRKAAECPDNKIYPSTIRFDPYDGDYLLAGFASTSREDQLRGESCLWNVNTGTQLHLFPETRNVFDVAWNPTRINAPTFAVGCVAGTNVNRGVRSVVKMYDPRSPERCTSKIELDCPALDMNDVMFCPFDDNYVVAGCTNGTTYVWDLRQTHKEMCLYSLVHGSPLIELADPESRERLDTGIRFCSWGHDRRRLYTGSSDGAVKCWDLYRAPEDMFVRDVVQLNSGVMCGSFSPDYSSLLLGEVNGSINVLEVGNDDRSIRDVDSFDLISAPDTKKPHTGAGTEDADSGVAASKNLVQSGQMALAPMGGFPVRQALQGPNYAGPFDSAMDAEDLRNQAAVFQKQLASGTDKCTVAGCNDVKRFTEEECGDSGRWKHRIPAELTLWRESGDQDAKKGSRERASLGIVLKLKCWAQGCSRRAFSHHEFSDVFNKEIDVPSCEAHHFGCLRGDATVTAKIGSKSSPLPWGPQHLKDNQAIPFFIFHCGVYRTDVLGYKKISNSTLYGILEDGNHKQIWERSLSRRGRRLMYGSDSEDDDDNGMDEYYAGLWGMQEAPAAPPLLLQTPPPPSQGPSPSPAPPASRPPSRSHQKAAAAIIPTSPGKPSVAPPSSSSPPVGRPSNGAQQSNVVAAVGSGGSDAAAVHSPGRRGHRFVVDDDDDDDADPVAAGPAIDLAVSAILDVQLPRQSPVAQPGAASPLDLARENGDEVGSGGNEGSAAVRTPLHETPPEGDANRVSEADVMDLDVDQPAIATSIETNDINHGNDLTAAPNADTDTVTDTNADADAPLPTTEGGGEAEAASPPVKPTRRRSSAASSQKSASSQDSGKSRTPCVPM